METLLGPAQPRQIVRGNREKLTPVFQELYSHVEQLVCARCQRKVREGEMEQKAGAVRYSYRRHLELERAGHSRKEG